MLSPCIVVQALLCLVSSVSASAIPRSIDTSPHLAAIDLAPRNNGPIKPKVFIINAFTPEAESFYAVHDFNLLAHNITIPGFSPKFPEAHCTANGEICQATTGESEINAASTVSALLYSRVFDLTRTYFFVAGIAGVNPTRATLGSATFARFEVQVALQYEFDIRDIGANFSTGYIPYGAKVPAQYPEAIYGTEVFELNEALRSRAMHFAKDVKLNDSTTAAAFRKRYPHAPANQPPSIVACDGATSDNFYSGPTLGDAFDNFTSLITNGTGKYCATAQEDSAILEALLRGAKAGLADFGRVVVMRTAANFDRPPPGLSPYQFFFYTNGGGFLPSVANLAIVGAPIVQGIVREWGQGFEAGVKATNYVGDIFGTLGGVPDFGPYPFFGEA